MGNRHVESGMTSVINPSSNPYLHIMRMPREDGVYGYEYVPQLSGLTLYVGHRSKENGIDAMFTIEIPILPELTDVPGPELETKPLVEQAIGNKRDEIMQAVAIAQPNRLAFSHGYAWGDYPEQLIVRLLGGEYKTSGLFKIGGRKRVQTTAVDIQEVSG